MKRFIAILMLMFVLTSTAYPARDGLRRRFGPWVTGFDLRDPGADRLSMYDDSVGAMAWTVDLPPLDSITVNDDFAMGFAPLASSTRWVADSTADPNTWTLYKANLGIGIVPTSKLHLKGDITVIDETSVDIIVQIYDSADDGIIDIRRDGGLGGSRISGSAATASYFGGSLSVGSISDPNSELHLGGTTPELGIGDADAEDAWIQFWGNVERFYIASDDSEDKLVIGVGEVPGTTPTLAFNNTRDVETSDPNFWFGYGPNQTRWQFDTAPDPNTLTIYKAHVGIGAAPSTAAVLDIVTEGANAEIRFSGAAIANIYQSVLSTDFYINTNAGVLYLGTSLNGTDITVKNSLVGILETDPNSELHIGGTTPEFTLGDADAEDVQITLMGNEQRYYWGLDDGTNTSIWGVGEVMGTTPAITVDSSQDVQFASKVGIDTDPNGILQLHDGGLVATNFIQSDSDIVHGIIGWVPTNVFFAAGIAHATNGGADVIGLSDNAGQAGLTLRGFIGVTDPTDPTPAIILDGRKKSGSGAVALAAAETVAQIQNGGTALTTWLGNGDVGFGTVTPSSAVDIVGDLEIDTGTIVYDVNNITADMVSAETYGIHVINSSGTGITLTLADGTKTGQTVSFLCSVAGNNIDISVGKHITSDPEVIRIDTALEGFTLVWDGTDWVEWNAIGTSYP